MIEKTERDGWKGGMKMRKKGCDAGGGVCCGGATLPSDLVEEQ